MTYLRTQIFCLRNLKSSVVGPRRNGFEKALGRERQLVVSTVHRTQFSVLEECISYSRILAENVLDLRSRIESKLMYRLEFGLGIGHGFRPGIRPQQ
jgi:hypothetical protein